MNILISSAGRRVSLLKYFRQEQNRMFRESKVIACDLDPSMSSASRIADDCCQVSPCTSPKFIDEMLEICVKYKVQVVIPTIDTELLSFAKNRELFESINTQVIISDPSFVTICRDKRLMNRFFINKGIKVPKYIDPGQPTFPAFIKPFDGSNSKDLYLVDGEDKISTYLQNNDNLMWLEYLSPKDYREYTIDLYYDRTGTLKCCVPRVRITVRGGETNKGITEKNEILIEFVKSRLGTIEGARGCITLQLFQSRLDHADIYGIEINPRFGGGYPLSYLAGANFPKWIIEEYIKKNDIEYFDDWEDGLLLLRYDEEMVISGFKYN